MDYDITIINKSRKVRLERANADTSSNRENYSIKVTDESSDSAQIQKSIIVERREPTMLLISIDNKMYWISQTKRTPSSVDFLINGNEIRASLSREAPSLSAMNLGVRAAVALVNEIVVSNFPAKVIAVRAETGSSLKEGETLVILEAMKMEAQVKAPKNCKVLEIFVREGDMVARGARLAHLRFA